MSNAIEVQPTLQFITKELGDFLVLDSGVNDLNRKTSRQLVPSDNIQGLVLDGFDELVYFKDEADLFKASQILQANDNAYSAINGELTTASKTVDDTTDSDKPVQSLSTPLKTEHALVFGTVSLDYGTKQVIAQPIYRVYPNKKGVYRPIGDIHTYIKSAWVNAFHDAMMPSGTAVTKTVKGEKLTDSNTILKIIIVICVILISMLSMYAVAKTVGYTGSSNYSTAISYNSSSLNGVQSNGNTQVKSVTTAGEDPYKQLNIDETEKLLSRMNINFDANNENLGCFTQ